MTMMFFTPILNNVLPVFLLMAGGQALTRFGMVDRSFFRASDRLVYFVLFPTMLFWKIGTGGFRNGLGDELGLGLLPAVLIAIFLTWLAGVAFIKLFGVSHFQAGTFSQVSIRFNTYIGMAIMLTAFGEEGASCFGIIIALAIPLINFLSVLSLTWHQARAENENSKIMLVIRQVLLNPFIIGCVAGLLYAKLGPPLPVFIENTLRLTSSLTLPLALLSVGAMLDLDKLKGYSRNALAASAFKLACLPLIGFALLKAFGVSGLFLQVGMIYFALPTSPSSHILSGQLDGDADYAVACIVSTTLLSFFSLSAALGLFG